ncbi:MAG: GNAT family N-acetyltransferase [Candidatus Hydrogenedentes bacterium]|nr:GNAT family N-acetyltransferase [Candidatus Hydrogenedentota bacterium]
MDFQIEDYVPERDLEAVRRIWHEVGWLDPTNATLVESMDHLLDASRGWVVRIRDEAECLVLCARGDLRYLDEDIPFSGVTGVTTSRIARKQGIAGRLTAHGVAEEARAGAMISGLGMFDQGYYDRLGFGTGTYDHWVSFDPARLNVEPARRTPHRLTREDWEQMHTARCARKKSHGFVTFDAPEMTRHHLAEHAKGFGLGYYDGPKGELSHYIWFRSTRGENGPYYIGWLACQTDAQFLELLGVIKNLGDQVHKVVMMEPPEIQLQDFIKQPLHQEIVSNDAKFSTGIRSHAFWQARICDLPGCLARTHLRCDELRFNLAVTDPIESLLDPKAEWRGVAGDYVVGLGKNCGAEAGTNKALPTLTCTVNAFTRMWLGVRSASGLSVTDQLEGPPELIEELDWAFRLPECKRDWEF